MIPLSITHCLFWFNFSSNILESECICKKRLLLARAMVKWLRQTTHKQEVVGSNPSTVYWMYVSDASYYEKPYMKIAKIKEAE
jgi:hypothetical protein